MIALLLLRHLGKYIQNVLVSTDDAERQKLMQNAAFNDLEMNTLPLPEQYIVSACHQLIEKVTDSLERYELGDAGRQIYEFLWDEYADWYIEISKTRMRDPAAAATARRVLVYVWERCLRLLHPFMPFLTETLWQQLPHSGSSIMIENWPKMAQEKLHIEQTSLSNFKAIQALIRSIRNARAEYNVEAGKKIAAIIKADGKLAQSLSDGKASLSLLGRIEESSLSIIDLAAAVPSTKSVHLVVQEGLEAFLPMADMVDREKELLRLSKQAEKLQKDINGLESRLKSKGFIDKAPDSVIAEVKATLADKVEQLSAVSQSIESLSVSQ